jgi:hypothetical protein
MTHAALAIAVSALLLAASPANGQQIATTFEELRRIVRIGEAVSVTDSTGATYKGRLAGLSASSLQVRQGSGPWTALPERDVNNVAVVRADPLWNGMMIGFAVGAAPVALVGGAASAPSSEVAAVAAGYGTIGLLAGLLIDAVNRQSVTIYVHSAESRTSHILLAPLYSPARIGIQFVVKR